jgi:hypothetical protein
MQTINKKTYTTEQIASALGYPVATLQRTADRNDWGKIYSGEILTDEQLSNILNYFARPTQKRTPESVQAAIGLMRELGITPVVVETPALTNENKSDGQDSEAPQPSETKAQKQKASSERQAQSSVQNFVKSEKDKKQKASFDWYGAILFAVFVVAMVFQMHHTAHIIALVEKGSYSEVWGWAYAVAFQFTASMLALSTGNKTALKVFGGIEFLVNLLYYAPWDNQSLTVTIACINVVASAGIAYAIYTYAELFTERTARKK